MVMVLNHTKVAAFFPIQKTNVTNDVFSVTNPEDEKLAVRHIQPFFPVLRLPAVAGLFLRLLRVMQIRTLEQTPLSQITAAFNASFSDYFIPLQFSEEGMAVKMKGEGIDKKYSAGAFDGDRLVGFILHGYDSVDGMPTVYNAGTGVMPGYRGRGLTAALYRYSIPLLRRQGIRHHLLEVIDNNDYAKKIYDAVGFQTVRKLAAFKCTSPINAEQSFDIRQLTYLPTTDSAFVSMLPAWQNSTASIHRDKESHQLLGVFQEGELVGYAAYVPAAGRIKQCAVHKTYRRHKIGTALFHHMQQNSPTGSLLVTNVEEAYEPGTAFLHSLGFEKILGLYEMKMVVS